MSHHPVEDHNPTDNPTFASVLEARMARRSFLQGGVTVAAATTLSGFALVGCSDDDNKALATPTSLGFAAVAKNLEDRITLPAGYSAKVLYAFGDPITAAAAAFANNGSQTDHEQRAGDQHDGMYYFGLGNDGQVSPRRSDRGLLVMNHEQVLDTYIHANGPTNSGATDGPRPKAEVDREMNAHGVSVIEVTNSGGDWSYVQGSNFNRRVTAFTPMAIHGPARSNTLLNTPYSQGGTRTRGTLNNCANGYTPWGTYLTCEENWFSYFRRDDDAAQRSAGDNAQLARYGMGPNSAGFSYRRWDSVAGDVYTRFDITVKGASASADYRNEANTFGYVVEIDPTQPASTPRKRTALGRFGHEGAWVGPVRAGEPIAYYMGCDSRFEYIYKFVSDALWDPSDANGGLAAGDKYLDAGKLYVAKFNADGTGDWVELGFGKNGLTAGNATFPFSSQGDICVVTRLAADSVGATRMDRPEWGAVNPVNGEIYMTLTNNTQRNSSDISLTNDPDAPNPRNSNANGHIIRWREFGGSVTAESFDWDIYLLGAAANADPASVNASGLSDDNDFSSPDGLWFDQRGVLWIQTDDGVFPGAGRSNNQMLAALPGEVGDGSATMVGAQATILGKSASGETVKRFLVGPKGCEITGITETPDGRTLFVNIQHPGENGSLATLESAWPALSGNAKDVGDATRPRSATIVITRDDGGVIAA
jgi:uncharacterized protein